MARITKRFVDGLAPDGTDRLIFDDKLTGFAVRVKPSGTLSYLIQYRNADGRTRRLTLGGHGVLAPDQARRLAEDRLARVKLGEDPSEDRHQRLSAPTVDQLADRYLAEHAGPRKKRLSVENDERLLRLYVRPRLGPRKVRGLTTADVARLHFDLRDKPIQANRTLALLSKMLNLAERWQHRPAHSNPCRGIERYPENKRKRYLTGAELARLGEVLARTEREGCEHPSVVLALRLLALTGCRRSEILTLRWDAVDFPRRCLALADSKTGAKEVPLGAPALEALAGADRVEGNPFVCWGAREGGHLVGLQRAWDRIRRAAGLGDVRLHDIRHSFASVGAGAGLGLPVIGALLGHTQAATTQRYAHLQADPLKVAADRIAGEIAAAMRSAGDAGF